MAAGYDSYVGSPARAGTVDLALLFALGRRRTYEVFLLSRIKEVYERTGDNDTAVAEGLQHAGASSRRPRC